MSSDIHCCNETVIERGCSTEAAIALTDGDDDDDDDELSVVGRSVVSASCSSAFALHNACSRSQALDLQMRGTEYKTWNSTHALCFLLPVGRLALGPSAVNKVEMTSFLRSLYGSGELTAHTFTSNHAQRDRQTSKDGSGDGSSAASCLGSIETSAGGAVSDNSRETMR